MEKSCAITQPTMDSDTKLDQIYAPEPGELLRTLPMPSAEIMKKACF